MIEFNDENLVKRIEYATNVMLKNYEIMFIYFGGSIAYGTYEEGRSDYDVNIVVDGLKGYFHTNCNDVDFFVYGRQEAMDKQNLANYLSPYFKTYIDEVLALDDTLIYLNPKYKKEFEAYKDIRLETKLIPYLEVFIEYHANIINDKKHLAVKRLYHVIRLHEILENYQKTRKFSLAISDKTKQEILFFKKNYDTVEGLEFYNKRIIPAFLDIERYYKYLMEANANGKQ